MYAASKTHIIGWSTAILVHNFAPLFHAKTRGGEGGIKLPQYPGPRSEKLLQ